MQKAVNFLSGLILGAVVGAATGLLLTPQSGQALQEGVRQRLNEVVDEGRRAAAERRAELEAQFAQAKRVSRGV
jgi:gas vesicle protein